MENKFLNEQEIARLFKIDSEQIIPDASIGERLNYTFLVKRTKYRTVQNSFVGFFSWILSGANLPAKAAVITIAMFLGVMNFQTNNSQFVVPGNDTTLNISPLDIDSAGMLPFYSDTCSSDKS